MVQAYGIFSGGLDSLLSVRILQDQGLNPTLLTFTSPFFALEQARAGARALGLPLREVDIYEELLALIKDPPHGLGRNLNPCIDCHALMFRRAGELLEAEDGPGFLFSGEVLGQRPMSQNPKALKTVARESGRWGLVLRPLSARLMPVTEAEENGWVDRDRLLALNGRGRRPQMDLAEKYGLPVPPPAGGCLLTDTGYCRRFKWLLEQPQGTESQTWPPARLAELIKRGRLFSSESGGWLIVGRNQSDNQHLAALTRAGDLTFHLEGGPGPTVLLPSPDGPPSPELIELGRRLAAAYGDRGQTEEAVVRTETHGAGSEVSRVPISRPADWEHLLIKAG